MKSGTILHGVKHLLKQAKSNAVPQIANIALPDGSLVACVIFENFTWENDELVSSGLEYQSLYSHVERVQVRR